MFIIYKWTPAVRFFRICRTWCMELMVTQRMMKEWEWRGVCILCQLCDSKDNSFDNSLIQNLVLSCFSMRILGIPLAPRYPNSWCCSSSHRALQPDAELPLELEPVELRSSKTEISIWTITVKGYNNTYRILLTVLNVKSIWYAIQLFKFALWSDMLNQAFHSLSNDFFFKMTRIQTGFWDKAQFHSSCITVLVI